MKTFKTLFSCRLAGLCLVAMGLSGCSSVSGLGGTTEFGCKAPQGVPCLSVSGVHENESAGALPWQQGASQPHAGTAAPVKGTSAGLVAPRLATADGDARPPGALRSDPTVIRIWIAPWEDTDGDLMDQSFVYLQIDAGRWLIEHNRDLIRRTFAPRPSSVASAPPSGAVPAPANPTAAKQPAAPVSVGAAIAGAKQ